MRVAKIYRISREQQLTIWRKRGWKSSSREPTKFAYCTALGDVFVLACTEEQLIVARDLLSLRAQCLLPLLFIGTQIMLNLELLVFQTHHR